MKTPFCPILLAGVYAAPFVSGAETGLDPSDGECRGSRCAWWVRDANDRAIGSCGLGNGQQFTDPAAPPQPPDATRSFADDAPF